MTQGLEWDTDGIGEDLKTADAIPESIRLERAEYDLVLRPDYAMYGGNKERPQLIVKTYPEGTNLEEAQKGESWSTSPAERMSQLCRATGVRLGLVTDGERWMLVDAPEDGLTSYASWYARLWSQEPLTLQAFTSLLNVRTVFAPFGVGDNTYTLAQLFDESVKHQDEVTETLGLQVQRAVEVFVQSLDKLNDDSNGELLEGIETSELYEAGLTFMMRLVFLLCAEERGLLLLEDETYEANYAVSTLRSKLRQEESQSGAKVLANYHNAWSRLLAVFRAVYAGIEHETLRLPPLGGSLFDPDRFPFLEGRGKDSNWKEELARPLQINNETVLLFLDAIQNYQGRTLSYRTLDVEQIGYVYEGLLERTVQKAKEPTVEFTGTSNATNPLFTLAELNEARDKGVSQLKTLINKRSGTSASAIVSKLNKELSDAESGALLIACENDQTLRDQIKPYYHLIRVDSWDKPLVYPTGSLMLVSGSERRETGTHYTPKSLTENVVHHTLEPVAYSGPAEGFPREDWQLKTPEELLNLKICDPAMGSGAFLVQACRWLSERLCEAWLKAENQGKAVNIEGRVVDADDAAERMPAEAEERALEAKRLIAERCLYGLDINPLAVELAKLALWLITLSKGRPFGFLDHNLKSGDTLLGITNLNQLYTLDMNEGKNSTRLLFAQQIEEKVNEAIDLRKELRSRPIRDIKDVETQAYLNDQAKEKLELPTLVADALAGETFKAKGKSPNVTALSVEVDKAFEGDSESQRMLVRRANDGLNIDLPSGKRNRKPFHWCLEFPEVFETGGFDAVVGNPPYLGGSKITGTLGTQYREFLVSHLAKGNKGAADLVVFFFLPQPILYYFF